MATATAAASFPIAIEPRFLQRAAMGDRAGAVPADRRSVAGLFHHRPSERRAVHRLSGNPALLMSRGRACRLDRRLPKAAHGDDDAAAIKREYSLAEIATMTRAAPARLARPADRGHLGAGALADIAVYDEDTERARCSARPPCLQERRARRARRRGHPLPRARRCASIRPADKQMIAPALDAYYRATLRAVARLVHRSPPSRSA